MMKLVLVISSLTSGGAERVLSILANSWAGMGRDVVLVTTHDDGSMPFYDLADNIKHRPIPLARIPAGGWVSNIKRVREIRSMIDEESPDVVVSFLNYTNILVLLACLNQSVPVVISERLDPRVHKLPAPWALLRRLLYPRAAVLVNQTEGVAELFRSWLGNRVEVVPNPVLEPDLTSDLPEFSPRKPFLAAMGRLHPQKGFETLLRAMAIVHEAKPEVGLTILGEGPQRPELEALRRELGLDQVVSLPGRFRNPHHVLKESELFVLSSVTEGFPNVLCEAMALGLPVVATDCPSGPAEIIRDGENGVLVPVGDPEAMAKAILTLVEDPESRQDMGKAGRQILELYSLDKILEMWGSVLFKACGPDFLSHYRVN